MVGSKPESLKKLLFKSAPGRGRTEPVLLKQWPDSVNLLRTESGKQKASHPCVYCHIGLVSQFACHSSLICVHAVVHEEALRVAKISTVDGYHQTQDLSPLHK